MTVIKSNSIVGKVVLKNIAKIDSRKIYVFLISFIKKLRTYGIKEKYIANILEDFFEKKYWNFIQLDHIWLLLNKEYSINYELIDPESRILESSLFINIPLDFLKKSYIRFWSIDNNFIESFNNNIASPLKKDDVIMPTSHEFLILINKYIGNVFKLSQIRDLFYKLEPGTRITVSTARLYKEKIPEKGVRELFVRQIEKSAISNHSFYIKRRQYL
ncbi:MAG: hypothetical protein QMB51_01910 [Patescibacteria group bacterium]